MSAVERSTTPAGNGAAVPWLAAGLAGVGTWWLASVASGRREPWDGGAYWLGAYPLSLVMAAWLGYRYPERPWRWALAIFLGQFVGMCVRNGEVGNLWPLGLALFGVLSLPAVAAARFASRYRR